MLQTADNDQQDEDDQVAARVPFKTAKQQLVIDFLRHAILSIHYSVLDCVVFSSNR